MDNNGFYILAFILICWALFIKWALSIKLNDEEWERFKKDDE